MVRHGFPTQDRFAGVQREGEEAESQLMLRGQAVTLYDRPGAGQTEDETYDLMSCWGEEGNLVDRFDARCAVLGSAGAVVIPPPGVMGSRTIHHVHSRRGAMDRGA